MTLQIICIFFQLLCVMFSVPGDGGSQFQAKLDKPTTVAGYCVKKTDYYYDLWLNFELLVPYIIDCFVDNMRYDLIFQSYPEHQIRRGNKYHLGIIGHNSP